VMNRGRLPERERLCRPQNPRAFPLEIQWVGLGRNNTLRTTAGLPVSKVESVAWSGLESRCEPLPLVDTRRRVTQRSWEERSD
jgi:hypothetical protein